MLSTPEDFDKWWVAEGQFLPPADTAKAEMLPLFKQMAFNARRTFELDKDTAFKCGVEEGIADTKADLNPKIAALKAEVAKLKAAKV